MRDALPPPPARVLEVGAGRGELATELGAAGHDVRAIDPAGHVPEVEAVALADLEGPAASFDAAVAVLSLHHVEPLEASLSRLGEVVRPGGVLVVDEFDVAALDERALSTWLTWRAEAGESEPDDPAAMVAGMRSHLHTLTALWTGLERWFDLGPVRRGAYLHRWHLPPGHGEEEERLIAEGGLPAVGARFTGVRRR